MFSGIIASANGSTEVRHSCDWLQIVTNLATLREPLNHELCPVMCRKREGRLAISMKQTACSVSIYSNYPLT